MAALALAVVAWGEHRYALEVATTMGMTTLGLMHIVAALEAREPEETIFKRYTIANRRFVQLVGAALVLSLLVTTLSPLQRIFDTEALTAAQWGSACRPDRLSGGRGAGQGFDRRTGESVQPPCGSPRSRWPGRRLHG
jgi:hypothetical protein